MNSGRPNYDLAMHLSPNFTVGQMTFTQHRDLDNFPRNPDGTPDTVILANLQALCVKVLEPIKSIMPQVVVTSGYRSPELNRAIGGAEKSQHLKGQAADLWFPAPLTQLEAARIIEGMALTEAGQLLPDPLPFDQLIHETGRWVHVSWAPWPRWERLTMYRLAGIGGAKARTIYELGLKEIPA